MRTIQQIESELAALRQEIKPYRAEEEAADLVRDESRFDAARAAIDRITAKIDQLIRERDETMYASLSDQVTTGAFSPRYQVVANESGLAIVDSRKGIFIRQLGRDQSSANRIAAEMNHFARLRSQGDRELDLPINLATRRR